MRVRETEYPNLGSWAVCRGLTTAQGDYRRTQLGPHMD